MTSDDGKNVDDSREGIVDEKSEGVTSDTNHGMSLGLRYVWEQSFEPSGYELEDDFRDMRCICYQEVGEDEVGE